MYSIQQSEVGGWDVVLAAAGGWRSKPTILCNKETLAQAAAALINLLACWLYRGQCPPRRIYLHDERVAQSAISQQLRSAQCMAAGAANRMTSLWCASSSSRVAHPVSEDKINPTLTRSPKRRHFV